MTMHTPGPWTWTVSGEMDDDCNISRVAVDWNTWKGCGYGGNPSVTDSEGNNIVSGGDGEYVPVYGRTDSERAANARLIAAAPELYEFIQQVAIGNSEYDALQTAARNLIAKV